MSKSLGNVIDPYELIKEYGSEAVRYYLARHISPFEDGDLTLESFKDAYNANLANGLGNLVSRVMKMAESYGVKISPSFNIEETVKACVPQAYWDGFESFDIKQPIDHIWKRIEWLDGKIQKDEPYKLIKIDEKKAKEVVSELLEKLTVIGYLLNPFMPKTSEKIKQLIEENKSPEKPLFVRKD